MRSTWRCLARLDMRSTRGQRSPAVQPSVPPRSKPIFTKPKGIQTCTENAPCSPLPAIHGLFRLGATQTWIAPATDCQPCMQTDGEDDTLHAGVHDATLGGFWL